MTDSAARYEGVGEVLNPTKGGAFRGDPVVPAPIQPLV